MEPPEIMNYGVFFLITFSFTVFFKYSLYCSWYMKAATKSQLLCSNQREIQAKHSLAFPFEIVNFKVKTK